MIMPKKFSVKKDKVNLVPNTIIIIYDIIHIRGVKMQEYYIHQIGNINNIKTYDRLRKILQSRFIASRDYLEKNRISFDYDNTTFELNIPDGKKYMYYSDDIHKDRVSLSDPNNRFIKNAIEKKDHAIFTCFDYDNIAFAVSKDMEILPREKTKGLALGEVQVEEKVDSDYISAIIVPIEDEKINVNYSRLLDVISSICEENSFPLDIINYEGVLLRSRQNNKTL